MNAPSHHFTLAQITPDNPFYHGHEPLLRVLVVGVLAYAAIVLLLRITGSRTLSKMNAFDFIVTIALGSTLSSVLLNKQIALAEGVLGFVVLIGLQFAVTWTSVRWPWARRAITASPRLVLHRGQFLHDAMRRARVTEEEVLAAARDRGIADRADLLAVILESDGSFSAIPVSGQPAPDTETGSTLRGVEPAP